MERAVNSNTFRVIGCLHSLSISRDMSIFLGVGLFRGRGGLFKIFYSIEVCFFEGDFLEGGG